MKRQAKRGGAALAEKAAAGKPIPSWEELRPEVTDELLQEITRRIVAAFDPEKVILFGSYAYGQPHIYSDIDLFVIMESDETLFPRTQRVAEVAHVDCLPMDVIARTPAEVRERLDMGDHFVADILRRGRVLYERGR